MAVQELVGGGGGGGGGVRSVNYNTGEQNKDMTRARQPHDWKDLLTVLHRLQSRSEILSAITQICGTLSLGSKCVQNTTQLTFDEDDDIVGFGMHLVH